MHFLVFQITETYAFLPREAVTRFLLGCTECQRRPRTPSPTNLATSQMQQQPPPPPKPQVIVSSAAAAVPASPTPGIAIAPSAIPSLQNNQKPREASHAPETKSLFNYRHSRHHKAIAATAAIVVAEKSPPSTDIKQQSPPEQPKVEVKVKVEEKYNPLSITNLLKKEPTAVSSSSTTSSSNSPVVHSSSVSSSTDLELRRTPESDRASSRSSASSKRRRMLPESRRTPSPNLPAQPLARPWSPGLDPKSSTPVDYSLPITTTYLKHQQRLLAAEEKLREESNFREHKFQLEARGIQELESLERERFSPAAGLIDTNLNLLATIQHLHCQVMLALTERLRPPTAATQLWNPSIGVLPAHHQLVHRDY